MAPPVLMKVFGTVWVLPVLIGAAGVSVLVFGGVHAEDAVGVSTVLQIVLSILIAGLGSVIAARHPRHRIALLLYLASFGLLLLVASSLVVEFGSAPVAPDFWDYSASWVFNVLGSVILYPVVLILFIFPTGYFLTRRWLWVGWATSAFTFVVGFVVLFSEEVGMIYDPESEHWHLANPIGFLPPEFAESMVSASVGVMMWLAIGGVASMIVRYMRADSVVRIQIKWVVYASAIAAVALATTALSDGNQALYLALALAALSVIPIAITIAITKYRLFEIDRLFSRTVSYTLVVVVLGAVFAFLTWLPSFIVGGVNQDGATGSTPPLFVAASTLVVAALFNPLRKRVQRRVDRRFNRSRYQAETIAEGFSATLQELLTVDEIAEAWGRTVEDALQPEATGIWINQTLATRQPPDSGRP